MERNDQPIFIKDPTKTYGLMEIVEGTSPMVEKAPEDTVDTFPHYIILLTISSLAVTFALLIISLFFDAPLEDLANPLGDPQSWQGPLVFYGDSGIDSLYEQTCNPSDHYPCAHHLLAYLDPVYR